MNKVKEYRERSGESQSRFARRIEMNGSQLCTIEQGRRTTQHTARKIAEALGVAPEEIFPDFNEMRRGQYS